MSDLIQTAAAVEAELHRPVPAELAYLRMYLTLPLPGLAHAAAERIGHVIDQPVVHNEAHGWYTVGPDVTVIYPEVTP